MSGIVSAHSLSCSFSVHFILNGCNIGHLIPCETATPMLVSLLHSFKPLLVSSHTNIQVFSLMIMDATREIPPSIATAIAEGNLDPVTMEAFDHFSSHESQAEPTVTQTSNEIVKPEATAQSTEESCFTIFSSHETREERVTGKSVNLM